MRTNVIHTGDALEVLKTLPDESVHCCVTSPPYWGLRDYGVDGQIGLEESYTEYLNRIVAVFAEVRRVLRSDGTLWLNLGDSYAGSWGAQSRGNTTGEDKATITGKSPLSARQIASHPHPESGSGSIKHTPGLKPKDLIGIPWRVAFALQADGWYLRQEIIWSKPNPMPESVKDRCTKAHEHVFLLAKSGCYFFDHEAIFEERTSDENANGFRGDCYVNGTIDNNVIGKRRARGNIKVPGGWDTEKGSHGSFNRRYSFSRETKTDAPPGQRKQHRADREPVMYSGGRNKRSVWTVATYPFKQAHFATFPPKLIEPCILAGCPEGGIVLDPFMGSGTVGVVATNHRRRYIGIDINPDYVALANERIAREGVLGNLLLNAEEVA